MFPKRKNEMKGWIGTNPTILLSCVYYNAGGKLHITDMLL